MRHVTTFVAVLALFTKFSLLAQAPQVPFSVITAGYSLPTGIAVAPGQVLRLFVQGVGASLTQPVIASSLPLPATLADISVRLQEPNAGGPGGLATLLPLFAVVPFSTCAGTVFDILNFEFSPPPPYPCGSFVAITLQIPFELQYTGLAVPANAAYGVILSIFESGTVKASLAMNIFADQIHVITACDNPLATAPGYQGDSPYSADCSAVAFHGDGTQVTSSKPAHKGEQLVMYALGLGATTPVAETGTASPPNATASIQLGFDFNPNEAPQQAYNLSSQPNLVFAGLVAGSVGLYQVDFIVPDPPPGTLPCPGNTNVFIRSNLTVSITGQASYDGAAICVAAP